MKPETQQIVELAERRVLALRSLAREMRKAQGPLTRLDAAAIRENSGEQQRLVDEVRTLDCESARLRRALPELDPATSARLLALARELQGVQAEVRCLNQVQARLLKAWRCSINLLMSFTGTYQAPRHSLALDLASELEARWKE
ncbi:MAG TPA: hypothetical protein VKM93_01980 [Terriglobia bacterium]|nr:hypothetical protein [Terriglobia bacterium]